MLRVIVFPLLTLSGLFVWKGHVLRARLRGSGLTGETFPRQLLFLVCLVFLFGAGHHVGWPLTPEVNAFTISLLAYPLVGPGLYLGWRNRADIRYWTVVFLIPAIMVIQQHFGPNPNEPPAGVVGPDGSRLLGSVAFGWLIVFTLVIVATLLYSGVLWARHRNGPSERKRTETGE